MNHPYDEPQDRPSPREEALKKFQERKDNPPTRIRNSDLPAGSPMYYYCHLCGSQSDVLPEDHVNRPKQLCDECQFLKDMRWV